MGFTVITHYTTHNIYVSICRRLTHKIQQNRLIVSNNTTIYYIFSCTKRPPLCTSTGTRNLHVCHAFLPRFFSLHGVVQSILDGQVKYHDEGTENNRTRIEDFLHQLYSCYSSKELKNRNTMTMTTLQRQQ